jgi:iron(III) transport system substrate-binding protein
VKGDKSEMNIDLTALNRNLCVTPIRLLLIVAALLLAALGPTKSQAQEKADWDKVIAAGKKEGKVVVYGTSSFRRILDKAKPIFEKRYGIKVEALTGRAREVGERVQTEVRTKRQNADLLQAGADITLPNVFRAGALDTWVPPSLNATHPDILKMIGAPKLPFTPHYVNLRSIMINRNRVQAKDEPKSWNDLTNSVWKGAILMDDPRSAGAGHALFVGTLLHPGLGEEFHRKLAQNNPVFLGAGTYQQIAARIAQGEFAVGFPVDAEALIKYEGSPVKWIPLKEGATHSIMATALVKNAPRPNAAKLLLEFTLSEEFQKIAAAENVTPARKGIKASRDEWSIDNVSLLPFAGTDSREGRDKLYRLSEEIYGVR